MATLKCHCTCICHPLFQHLWLTPYPAVLAVWLVSWKKQTELSPSRRLHLSTCSSWCSSGSRKFNASREPSARVYSRMIKTFILLPWEKSKNLLKGLFPVILSGNVNSTHAAAREGTCFLGYREKHCRSNTQTKQGTGFRLICHSLLYLSEIYCQLDSISLCLLIWLKGRFIKAQHRIECCTLIQRVMRCRPISFPFPTWWWDCRARWGFAGYGVTQGQFWGGGCSCWLTDESTPSSPSRRGHTLFFRRFQVAAQRQKGRWERGSGIGNDTWKDNKNGKKIKGLKIAESEMTAPYCHCCHPHCCFITLFDIVLADYHSTVPSQYSRNWWLLSKRIFVLVMVSFS